jgi:hypothetical protein
VAEHMTNTTGRGLHSSGEEHTKSYIQFTAIDKKKSSHQRNRQTRENFMIRLTDNPAYEHHRYYKKQ